DILREAINAQPDTRFERAHFKEFGKDQLLFETAYYVSDRDYNRYMDMQQAINLAVYGRLQQEGIVPVRKPATEPGGGGPAGKARPPEEAARPSKAEAAPDQARQVGSAKIR